MSFGWIGVGRRPLRAWGLALSLAIVATPFACADSQGAPLELPDTGSPIDDPHSVPDAAVPGDASRTEDAAEPASCGASSFCATSLPVQVPLVAVTASSADDTWAVGGDVILRWDGVSWQIVYRYVPTVTSTILNWFTGIQARRSDDVWALGYGFIVRYSTRGGSSPTFREIETAFYTSTASWLAPGSDALWVVRSDAQVFRLREDSDDIAIESWIPRSGPEDTLQYAWEGVWGSASDDVYVTGRACPTSRCTSRQGAIAHYDGVEWTTVLYPDETSGFGAVYGATDLHQVSELWVGSGVPSTKYLLFHATEPGSLGEAQQVPLPGAGICTGGRGSGVVLSPNEAWISTGCLVYRWNGTELVAIPTSFNGLSFGLVNGIWAGSAGDAWIVGQSIPRDPNYPTRLMGFAALHESGAKIGGGQP